MFSSGPAHLHLLLGASTLVVIATVALLVLPAVALLALGALGTTLLAKMTDVTGTGTTIATDVTLATAPGRPIVGM